MGLIYHEALENVPIMRFMNSCPWNESPPVFIQLLDNGEVQLRIFLIVTALNGHSYIKAFSIKNYSSVTGSLTLIQAMIEHLCAIV